MMTKHIDKSQKKVSNALNVFNTSVNEILKANTILEKGMAIAKKEFDDTTNEIVKMQNKVSDIGETIKQHEDEINKNLQLLEKFKPFLQ